MSTMFTPEHWTWAQWTLLGLMVVGLGIALANHGKPETGTKNAWNNIFGFILTMTFLWFGGFFRGVQ